MSIQWIPVDKIQHLIQLEPFIIFWILLPLFFLFYKIFLKKITEKRHATLQKRFSLTFYYLVGTTILSATHWIIFKNLSLVNYEFTVIKIANYLSLLALFLEMISVVKLAQILVYLYLFFMNMSVGVPRLLANIFTLIFSLILISWVASDIFGFQPVAVLTTSAVFSLVLGLALQDNLGNLFSGIALQIDRPFKIGDWIEIHSGPEKWIGQIQEINWRATTLMGFSDEILLIPNRIIAQAQLINFSHHQRPARFNHVFRFRFDVSIPLARKALLEGLANIPEILAEPSPRTLVTEVSESWVTMKIFYSLNDYGKRYRIGDLVITQILECTRKYEIVLATPILQLANHEEEV